MERGASAAHVPGMCDAEEKEKKKRGKEGVGRRERLSFRLGRPCTVGIPRDIES